MPQLIIKNIAVHYHEQGDVQQPTLLFIHGLGCSVKYWGSVFEAAELAKYRILALDLPGFGESEKPDDYDYTLPSQADIVFELMQQLHLETCSLIGHSMGGSIAILLALKAPEKVDQLLVIEPNLRACDAQLSQDIIQYTEPAFVKRYADFRKNAIATVQNWFISYHKADLENYISELLKTTPISMYRSASSLIRVTSGDTMLRQFQHLRIPKYFLVGEETMKKHRFPDALHNNSIQIMIVPRVGHMMMVDNPSLFNRTLASILALE